MDTPTLDQDIARGIEIRQEIESLNRELKTIETRIRSYAEAGPQLPLKDEDREGKKYLARGAGKILPVIFESDLLIASFPADSEAHKTLTGIAGHHLPKLFKEVHKYERVQDDGQKFRRTARQLLEPDQFAEFIRACLDVKKDGIPKSRIVVGWKELQAAD